MKMFALKTKINVLWHFSSLLGTTQFENKVQKCWFLCFEANKITLFSDFSTLCGGRIARVVLASNFCRGNDAAGQVQNLWWTFATKHGRRREEYCQLLPPTAPRVPTRNPSKNQAFLLSSWRFPPWFSQWFQVCLSLTERFSTLSGQKMWSLETINQKFWCGNTVMFQKLWPKFT